MGMTNAESTIYDDGTYHALNPTWHEEDSAWKATQVLGMIGRHNLAPTTVCDVGCGAGGVLVCLASVLHEASFIGYDVSSDALALADAKSTERIRFIRGEVEGFYDLLLALDVFEHVPDYYGFLRKARGHAHYKIFHIPLDLTVHGLLRDVLSSNRRALGHLHYFTKATALATLVDCGYEIVDWTYTGAVVDLAKPTLRTSIATAVRRLGFRIAPDRSELIAGGYALLVLAR